MSLVVSDALPIQFWPIAVNTFNEDTFAYIDKRSWFQEFLQADNIKLQCYDTEASNNYVLRIVDINGNELQHKYFDKTVTSINRFDIEFTFAEFSLPDQLVRFYISSVAGSLDDQTLDSDTLDTLGASSDVYKSDFISFRTSIVTNPGYGTRMMFYKSDNNFAGIKYPNNGNYFGLRVASRFYKPRNVKIQTFIPLSGSNIITTSIQSTKEKLFETAILPQYMLDKIELILQHCVSGSVIIDGIEWQSNESFDRSDIDVRCAMDIAKTWLSKGVVRNII